MLLDLWTWLLGLLASDPTLTTNIGSDPPPGGPPR